MSKLMSTKMKTALLLGAAIVSALLLSRVGRSPATVPNASSTMRANDSAIMPSQAKPLGDAISAPTFSQERLEAIETLSPNEYLAALQSAVAEIDLQLRSERVFAILSQWAAKDIRAAGEWARNQSFVDSDQAIAAVFRGGGSSPDVAEKYARDLIAIDDARAAYYGSYLIDGLLQAENYSNATKFALSGGESDERGWVVEAYYGWAKRQPRTALFGAEEIANSDQQRIARHAVYSSWAAVEPAALAEIAIGYPEGDDRKLALTESIRVWIQQDPAAAGEWISKQRFSPEMEAALDD